jgi:hypothetical protein
MAKPSAGDGTGGGDGEFGGLVRREDLEVPPGRRMLVRRCARNTAWFDFDELFTKVRSMSLPLCRSATPARSVCIVQHMRVLACAKSCIVQHMRVLACAKSCIVHHDRTYGNWDKALRLVLLPQATTYEP